jgi:hypothetical protein
MVVWISNIVDHFKGELRVYRRELYRREQYC